MKQAWYFPCTLLVFKLCGPLQHNMHNCRKISQTSQNLTLRYGWIQVFFISHWLISFDFVASMLSSKEKKQIMTKVVRKTVNVKSDHCSKFSNLSNLKEEAWKNQGFNGIWTRDLRDTSAMLYQLSYEATHWEWGQFYYWVHIFPCSEVMWSIYELKMLKMLDYQTEMLTFPYFSVFEKRLFPTKIKKCSAFLE